ncbi:MAG TPA: glycerol-3-phosphate 1-O-acyltransferase PlsY [Rhizomicrobium sp.]|jgi:glycerol-3-phosphate acyltransferase PlsY|nr:glycerol-3-phosphate 1-O-acyltransferase PlsY [Rhizomicrobium sp.]
MFDALNTIDWQDRAPTFFAALVLGYLVGSIPFGLLFSWASGAGDVRKMGSGNIGATNVLRTGKRWAALATLVCDGGKGLLAVLFVGTLHGDVAAVFAGLGAFLGHVFPMWLRFRGGKGVATFLGVTLALAWPVGLLALATWLAAAAAWRISSLAALVTAALVPVYMMLFSEPLYAIFELLLAFFIFALHRGNIGRIASGREPRIGTKVEMRSV